MSDDGAKQNTQMRKDKDEWMRKVWFRHSGFGCPPLCLLAPLLLTLHGDNRSVWRGGGSEDSGRRAAGSPLPVRSGP